IQLAQGARYYYEVREVWDERQEIHRLRAEAARRLGDAIEEAYALAHYVEIRSKQERAADTQPALARIRDLIQHVELPDEVAFAVQHAFALDAWMRDDLATAAARWRDLLPVAQRLSGQPYVVNRHWLATCLHRQGQRDAAEVLYRAALEDAKRIGDVR